MLAQQKQVTYQTDYAGKSPLMLSYDNSFIRECTCSSTFGRGDGPVQLHVGPEAEVCGFEIYLRQFSTIFISLLYNFSDVLVSEMILAGTAVEVCKSLI